MSARPVDPEKIPIKTTLPRLFTLLCVVGSMVGSGAWYAALKLNSIDTRLAALQASGWTMQDQERQMNWLRWDNAGTVKVRDAREVVAARTP